jgi:hypothetical protein
MAKGGDFERLICKKLSLWWSKGKTDDLCWRSSQSGGRATVRHRKGKKTAGHCGDICLTSDRMKAFFKLFTVEVKIGYPKITPLQLLDRPSSGLRGNEQFAKFLIQAKRAAKRAGTLHWMFIHRRSGRSIMLYLPTMAVSELRRLGVEFYSPYARFNIKFASENQTAFTAMPLETFFEAVDRDDIKNLAGGIR